MNIIAHLDEIFLKKGNQLMFIRQLIKNIQELFPGTKVTRCESCALWIENLDAEDLDRLTKIPGLSKLAPALQGGNSIIEIKKLIDALPIKDARTFRISSRRLDKKYLLNSVEIEKMLGAYVVETKKLKVDLKNYDVRIHIDVGTGFAKVYTNMLDGAGGLPVGSLGKILCLLSGGIDSPVAAYEMMKRGAEVELIHFQNQTQTTEEVSQKIFDLAKVLARYQQKIKLNVVPFAEWQKMIVMKVSADYRMILSRRLMFRIAENTAKNEGILALATGDSLGQVASQTIENLHCVYFGTESLKLAPLIGQNKADIMHLARRIGTLEVSNRPYEDCCSLFVAKHPETRAQLKTVLDIENNMDLSAIDKTQVISYYISLN